MTDGKKYQVALSFAGAQREYALPLAKHLRDRGVIVFYDEFEAANLLGKNLIEEFEGIYREAEYVVILVSEAYLNGMWTLVERQAAVYGKLEKRKDSIIPVRFDNTEIPGILPSIGCIFANKSSPAEAASMIATKLGISPSSKKASEVPPPQNVSLTDEVGFDWNSYNGRYVIGSGELKFEIAWDGCSKTSARIYNGPDSIRGVALAKGATSISQVQNAASLDYSSDRQIFSVGQVMVLWSKKKFYAAIQLLSIKDMQHGDEKSEFRFRYAIQPDGSDNFSEFQDWEAAAAE